MAANIEYGGAASDDTGTCKISPTDPCTDDPSNFHDLRVYDHFGWDPRSPEDWLAQADDPGKEFRWYVGFPTNTHSAYEGIILQGRMLANAFLREFENPAVFDLSPFAEDDVAALFPYDTCPTGERPSPENICWIDYSDGVPDFNPIIPELGPLAGGGPFVSSSSACVAGISVLGAGASVTTLLLLLLP